MLIRTIYVQILLRDSVPVMSVGDLDTGPLSKPTYDFWMTNQEIEFAHQILDAAGSETCAKHVVHDVRTFVDDSVQAVHLHQEVVTEEHESHDGEEIDEDDGQDGCQQDGATVLGHGPDHVEQRLLTVHDVQ